MIHSYKLRINETERLLILNMIDSWGNASKPIQTKLNHLKYKLEKVVK